MTFTPRTRTLWPLAAAGLLVIVVIASMAGAVIPGSRPAPRSAPTEPPAAQALALQTTATPTPRVIAIPGGATPPTPAPAPASQPTATSRPDSATAETPAPWAMTPSVPAATTVPAALPTPAATEALAAPVMATAPAPARPVPTATASPTAPTPTPAPTSAPKPSSPVTIEFAASDWAGGYYRGDSRAYGRPWTAVYGALSDYPRASLFFTLDAAPADAASLIVTGLDDEWAELNEIALEVNGQIVFSGEAPFANWDGVGDGANATWLRVAFTIPPKSLLAGPNEIAITNLMPSGNFDAPPYLLLADAVLEVDTPGAADASQADSPDNAARGDERDRRDNAKADKDTKKRDKAKSKEKRQKRKHRPGKRKNR